MSSSLKRKSLDNDSDHTATKRPNTSNSLGLKFKPSTSTAQPVAAPVTSCHWSVQWRKPQYKKNKSWESDGVLSIEGLTCCLWDTDGKEIARAKTTISSFNIGDELFIGGKDVLLDSPISEREFLAGTCFGTGSMPIAKSGRIELVPVPLLQTSHSSRTLMSSKPSTAFSAPFKPVSTSTKPPLAETTKTNLTGLLDELDNDLEAECSYWTVNWRKPQTKKHKTWDGDGILAQEGLKITLFNEAKKVIGSGTWNGDRLRSGTNLHVGGKEVELGDEISKDDYDGDNMDLQHSTHDPVPQSRFQATVAAHKFVPPAHSIKIKPKEGIAASSFYASVAPASRNLAAGVPRHDPKAQGAIVMKEPSAVHQAKYNKKKLPVIPVVIDPFLGKHLRPHQIEGVKFMYESVMGLRKHEGNGCILADEMGLGKTLQTIALLWTVMQQNPYGGGGPIVGKAIVVCPVSLVNNWRKEIRKWLGPDRLPVFMGDKDKTRIKQFVNAKKERVLIIGYEKLLTVIQGLRSCQPPIGLIICDEGHRLKSANNKTSKMFDVLSTNRRIILSGTPIQNDLGEFHAMADFCNPGLLDNYKTFSRIYEAPIVKSRAPGCTEKNRELGTARMDQLLEISKSFVLRRTADILENYLPPKHEYVVFVRPTALQLRMFSAILNPAVVDDVVQHMTKSLPLINTLTKVCNSPILLKKHDDIPFAAAAPESRNVASNIQAALALLPSGAALEDISLSGKLTLLGRLLRALRKHTDEKCVIVSNYTSTLNIIQKYCEREKYTYLRLDGSTKVDKRQEHVDDFNRASQSGRFVFLLSTKAGGVGLNLIGASRLVLIDSDWNPAHDLQAMARIHRDGQKKPVFIYRLVTAGTIDEKIFQRQVTKTGLSDSLMGSTSLENGNKSGKDGFTAGQLKDLFTINNRTTCHTHELLECDCEERRKWSDSEANACEMDDNDQEPESDDKIEKGFVVASDIDTEKQEKKIRKKKRGDLAALEDWSHVDCLQSSAQEYIKDALLQRLLHDPKSSSINGADSEPEVDVCSDDDSIQHGASMLGSRKKASSSDSMQDLPGGTITFIFERKTKQADEPVIEEDELTTPIEDVTRASIGWT
ncbi:helicase [Tulasnella sp. JGI-2019a]|nr:helicase [Tulasnella sp. JGI-2019a]KAG9035662.1 helicase [Tulasnella sp. JGI-2019a]